MALATVRKGALLKQVASHQKRLPKGVPPSLTFGLPLAVTEVLHRLSHVGAPEVLQAIVLMIMLSTPVTPWIDALETFAGKHEATHATMFVFAFVCAG